MTTQHTHYEQNDVDATVVEHLFSPDTAVSSTAIEMLSSAEEEMSGILPSSAELTDTQNARQDEAPAVQAEHGTGAVMTAAPTTQVDITNTDMVEMSPTEVDTVPMDIAQAYPADMNMAEVDVMTNMAQTESVEMDTAGVDTESAEMDTAGMDMAGADIAGASLATAPQVLLHENTEAVEDESVHSQPIVELAPTELTPTDTEEHTAFSFIGEIPLGATLGGVRSFADYIEEFRQTEARHSASLHGSQEAFSLLSALTSDVDTLYQAPVQSDASVASATESGEIALADAPFVEEKIETTSVAAIPAEEQGTVVSTPVQAVDETTEMQTPTLPDALPPSRSSAERPVSPLLRPATRLRLPRHGNVRQREEDLPPAIPQTPSVAPEVPPTPLAATVPTETVTEQAKPTRRYRFDRPSTASTPPSSAQPQRIEENREKDLLNRTSPTPPTRQENGQSGLVTETQSAKLQEPVTPELPEMERRRRYGQDRHQEQPLSVPPTPPTSPAVPMPSITPTTSPVASQSEVVTTTPVPAPPVEEIAPEDLPPLEYSELQKATSRRRRRHRTGPNNGTPPTPAISASPAVVKPTTPETSAPTTPPVATPVGGTSPAPAMPTIPATPARASNNIAAPAQQYNLVSGYTLNQMNQGNDQAGPFMGPEPSPARGSVSTRNGRNIRAEVQRSPVYPVRSPDVAPSTTSIQQLGSLLSQAIQTQTDRMVTELRRANQAPPNISVTFPPFPSTERVGVFVDVANLLYSARTLRISINFGKLLDFLRGNRRLVRAHAYCPTSPQPGEDQMFLQAVKGLGYRITTKHYKTFASGARKADLDLDLCMDVVRLVEGRAVDCVVLVSGDSDFMPMLDYCSDHGVRVEVAAFDEAMSATLRQSCDLFINLSMLEEIRS